MDYFHRNRSIAEFRLHLDLDLFDLCIRQNIFQWNLNHNARKQKRNRFPIADLVVAGKIVVDVDVYVDTALGSHHPIARY